MQKVVNQPKRGPYTKAGPLSNTLALYDFAIEEVDFKGWFYYVLKLYEYYGYPPIKMGCMGQNAPKSSKLTTFKYGRKLVEKFDFKGVDAIEIYTIPQETPDIYPDEGPLSIQISAGTASGKGDAILCLDDEVESFERKVFEKLACDLYQFFKPQYGIFYQREFKKGPAWYAGGVIQGLDRTKDFEEREKIGKWGNAYCFADGGYKTGDLRDIYTLNFLSQLHLDQKVGDLTLEQWINSKEAHGELKKLAENFWSWYVKPAYIPYIREVLRPTGFVLCL